MPDYSKGKIYAIRSYKTDDVYIGSTTQTLAQRLGKHRAKYRRWINKIECYYTSFEIVKYGDEYIELVEEYPCENVDQLRKKEGEIIRSIENCINKRIENRTKQEYYKDTIENRRKYRKRPEVKEKKLIQDKKYRDKTKEQRKEYDKKYIEKNKEKIKKQKKEYREKNKEAIQKQKKEQFICECGGSWIKGNGFKRHEKTKKHQNYIQFTE